MTNNKEKKAVKKLISFTESEYKALCDYRFAQRVDNLSRALFQLFEKAISSPLDISNYNLKSIPSKREKKTIKKLLSFTPTEYKTLMDYRFEKRVSTLSASLNSLFRKGIALYEMEETKVVEAEFAETQEKKVSNG